MKFAWVIEGPYRASSSYTQQINLFSNALHERYGYESVVANAPVFDDRYQMILVDKLKEYGPDFIISFGGQHFLNLPTMIDAPMLAWMFQGGGQLTFYTPWEGVTFGCISMSCYDKVVEVDPGALYVPHAFDPEVFSLGNKHDARDYLGIKQGVPVVAMVSTNYGDDLFKIDRKNWAGGLDAFAALLNLHPDALLYVHSNAGVANGFINIPQYAEKIGISDSLIMADQSHFIDVEGWDYPQEHVAQVYRAADVLLFPSIEEGFGLPLIEAQACGIPVVTSKNGPMAELAISGVAVSVEPILDNPGLFKPDQDELVRALESLLYVERMAPKQVSQAVQQYAVGSVVEDKMYPAIQSMLTKGE